jgi:hypothetical protein
MEKRRNNLAPSEKREERNSTQSYLAPTFRGAATMGARRAAIARHVFLWQSAALTAWNGRELPFVDLR